MKIDPLNRIDSVRLEEIKFAFFGSSDFSVHVLDALEKAGCKPILIITTPDKPIGRKQIITPTKVKIWGNERNIPVLTPEKLDAEVERQIRDYGPDVSVVASYGKILPKSILDLSIARHGTLNIHPSLLPKYRGATPIQSAMIDDMKNTGVTVILLDEQMDHGPILGKKEVSFDEWPVYEEVEKMLAYEGAKLLVEILPKWVKILPEIFPTDQDHDMATFTKKTNTGDAEISLSNPRESFLKIQAYHHSPVAYFNIDKDGKKIKVKVTEATYSEYLDKPNEKLVIKKVIPEGRGEMSYRDFLRGFN